MSEATTKKIVEDCCHGHSMIPSNCYRDKHGNTSCKTCRREKTAENNEAIRVRRAEEAKALRFLREFGTTPDVEYFISVVQARAERLRKASNTSK